MWGIELDSSRIEKASRASWPNVRNVSCADALAVEWPRQPRVIVMNPPFKYAEEFVRKGIDWVMTTDASDEANPLFARANRRVCAVLLRVAFLESVKRIPLHRDFPSDLHPLSHRPSFTDDGQSDKTAYAWFVWSLGGGGHIRPIFDAPPPRVRARRAPRQLPPPEAMHGAADGFGGSDYP